MIKTIPKKRNAKWLSEEALQIAMKRREAKGKGEMERYTHLNTEFQRIARRDKKAFLSDQCKEIEENNRMGKTRDIFKKIRDTKGTFHAKMGLIKDRNGMDLTEAGDIKKRWQEYTEELYKKELHNPDNHDGVITHLEPDILECEVKWALESITTNKASGGEGPFQILKDDAVKRREAKGKGEKERYKHLNAEFQRIARTDKKAFLSDQCKEIEENNRMRKTIDLFKKLEIPREHFMQRWAR